jgi:glutamate 5-kinase
MSVIVVKLGSSTLVGSDGGLRDDVLEARVRDLVRIRHQGQRPIVVSSGAVACGLGRLGIGARPTGLADLQAASAVGQGILFQRYSALFAPHGIVPAQVLLTSADLAHRTSYLNARTTLARLLDLGTVPIVNENDTTATDELTFGDNDVLAAQVAILLGADRLLLLTERDGLYGSGPDGTPVLLGDIPSGTRPDELELAEMPASRSGRGGIASKVAAAAMATGGGVSCVIASGTADGVIGAIASGRHVGTRFRPSGRPESAFKLWLRHARTTTGSILVDAGAARALRERGTSLLAVGVVGCTGAFQPGDAVQVFEASEQEPVGKGIVRMQTDDLRAVAGMKSEAVRARFPDAPNQVIHRDEFVLVGGLQTTTRPPGPGASPGVDGRG